jgi:leader peptidase (prepilin peptidase)/N-methyltransferase
VSAFAPSSSPRSSSSRSAALRRLAWQAPLAVVLVGVSFVVVGVRFELVGCLYLAVVTPELCRIDFAEHRLPNALVLPGLAFGAVGLTFGWLAASSEPLGALVVTAATTGFFGLLCLAGGMGMGDVKLVAALALSGGTVSVAVVVGTAVLGFLVAGTVALTRLAAGAGGGSIAFGPYLLCGFWASIAVLPVLA